jgi:hypothetical protein
MSVQEFRMQTAKTVEFDEKNFKTNKVKNENIILQSYYQLNPKLLISFSSKLNNNEPNYLAFTCMQYKTTDTTAAEARRGKDMQGIPWGRLSISREKYRQTRLLQYKNYENIHNSGQKSQKVQTTKGGLTPRYKIIGLLGCIILVGMHSSLTRFYGYVVAGFSDKFFLCYLLK